MVNLEANCLEGEKMNKLFIFVYYLVTEPFIELWEMAKTLFEKGSALNYPRTWQWIFLFLTIGAYLAKNRLLTNIFGVILIITIVKSEWDSGLFIEKYRKRLEEKAIKMQEAELKEGLKITGEKK